MAEIKKILWFTWKDRENPSAGGAEVVNEELARRLAGDGIEIIFVVANFSGGEKEETKNGYKIFRPGNKWTIYWKAFRLYKEKFQGWPDLVIDEMNTIPFFCKFFVKEKNVLFVHQLCREIWFFQMFFPLNLIGYLIEPIYLLLLNDRKVITVSNSTKRDLMKFGFAEKNISIISEGIEIKPPETLDNIEKFSEFTILSLGSVRSMKRTAHIVSAFEIAKKQIPELRLILAGDANCRYGKKVLRKIKNSDYGKSIQYLGKVSCEEKIKLLRKSHVLCCTSVKEGWGLVVTEANSQGTPAIVYNVDGLRDSVRHNETGLIAKSNNPDSLEKSIVSLCENKLKYDKLKTNAWRWSREINFEKSYHDFLKLLRDSNI
ncbi:glycosyltransferase family 4 protein [Patescibacteria group bacterium]|nr:glycosyltransferase family 4 protein [Patescibacteria group bacterium]